MSELLGIISAKLPFGRDCRFRVSNLRTIASFVQKHSRHLALGVPDGLEETIALGKAVEGVVRLAHGANEAGESVDDVLALDGTAVLVDLGDGDLARTVVLGLDDAARRRALAGDVTRREFPSSAFHLFGETKRQKSTWGRHTGRQFRRDRSPFWLSLGVLRLRLGVCGLVTRSGQQAQNFRLGQLEFRQQNRSLVCKPQMWAAQ